MQDKLNQSHRVAIIAIGEDGRPAYWPNKRAAFAIVEEARRAPSVEDIERAGDEEEIEVAK